MVHRYPLIAAPVLLLATALLLLLAGTFAFLPRTAGSTQVHRPPRPTVVAAINLQVLRTVNGRIAGIAGEGFTVNMLLGRIAVVELHKTIFLGATGTVLPESSLRKGDRVIVSGYESDGELLARSIRDTSRR